MNYIKHIERLEKIDKLIRKRRTGTPEELARNIGVSRRQLYNYLDELRSYGVEINYFRVCQSYRYTSNTRLRINFECEVIDNNQIQNTAGGFKANKIFQELRFSSLSGMTM